MRIKDKHTLHARSGAGAEPAVTDVRTVHFVSVMASEKPSPGSPPVAAPARLLLVFCNVSGMHCFLSVFFFFFLTPLQTTSGCFRNLRSEGGWLSVSLMFKMK